MATCGSLEWTRKRAEEEADKAIAVLQVLLIPHGVKRLSVLPILRYNATTDSSCSRDGAGTGHKVPVKFMPRLISWYIPNIKTPYKNLLELN